MAYLDLKLHRQGSRQGTQTRRTVAETSTLSAGERLVVLMARRDGLASITAPRRARRIINAVFGFPLRTKLADARLEALRRFAVIARIGGRAGIDERSTLIFAGFAPQQIAEAERLALGCSTGGHDFD